MPRKCFCLQRDWIYIKKRTTYRLYCNFSLAIIQNLAADQSLLVTCCKIIWYSFWSSVNTLCENEKFLGKWKERQSKRQDVSIVTDEHLYEAAAILKEEDFSKTFLIYNMFF